ncbi:MAG: alpha/beta hydrolase [bacterium]|nr:alpha/beta hydrolase [bacterium]
MSALTSIKIPPYVGYPLLAVFFYFVLYFLGQRTLFQPLRFPRGWWEIQPEIGAEDVWLTTPDGLKLHGWWKQAPGSDLVTLYLHGNAGNVSHRGSHMVEIAAAGSSVLVLDYRGYGKSEGKATEKGFYTDAETAYRHLLDTGYAAKRILLHGESLGCAVAVELASRVETAGVILEAPFTSASEAAGSVVPFLGPLVVRGFDSKERITSISTPLLIIHGDADEVIDFELGKSLFEAAAEPKDFWVIPGANHNNIVEHAGPEYATRLQRFYENLQ